MNTIIIIIAVKKRDFQPNIQVIYKVFLKFRDARHYVQIKIIQEQGTQNSLAHSKNRIRMRG